MITLQDAHAGSDAAYYGDHADWLVSETFGTHRAASTLTRSNYEVLEQRLRAVDGNEETWHEESSSHWAVGWVANIAVKPESRAAAIVNEAEIAVADYPVLDEEHFSDLEFNESIEYWNNCSLSERVGYLQENNESVFAARASYSELYERAEQTAYRIRDYIGGA